MLYRFALPLSDKTQDDMEGKPFIPTWNTRRESDVEDRTQVLALAPL